jgi:hypothetical protein
VGLSFRVKRNNLLTWDSAIRILIHKFTLLSTILTAILLFGACTEQVKVSEIAGASSDNSTNSNYTAGVPFRYIFYSKNYMEAVNNDVTVNIRVVDIEGNLTTNHSGEIFLSLSGSATGSQKITVSAGVGSATIRDSIEESVLLTLAELDGKGLRVPQGEYIKFSTTGAVDGAATRFIVYGDALKIADGTSQSFTVEAVDDNDVRISDYDFDVKVAASGTTTTDQVVDIVGGTATLDLVSTNIGSVTITLSDIRNTGLDCSDTHQFEFVAGAASKLTIVSGTSAYVGIQETVTVKAYDANDNFVSSYSDSATLTFNGDSGDGALSFSSGIATTDIRHNSIATQTIGTSSSLTDDGQSIQFVAGGAYQFVIDQTITSATVGTSAEITVRVRDYTNTVDATDYQGSITLVSTGSTTGEGLVNIVNGVGSINITNTIAEAVALSLTDSAGSSLDSSSSLSFTFEGAAKVSYQLEPISNTTAGNSSTVTVKCLDQYGNLAGSGCGVSVTLTDDGAATFGTITSGAAGNQYSTTISNNTIETVTVTLTEIILSVGVDDIVDQTQDVTFSLGSTNQVVFKTGNGINSNYRTSTGYYTTVTVEAQDLGGNIVTSENRDIVINIDQYSGHATTVDIEGLNIDNNGNFIVDIIEGVGTFNIKNSSATDMDLLLGNELLCLLVTCDTVTAQTITFEAARVVAPRFSAAPNWNNYIKTSDLSACSGATRCTHGGHYKKIDLTGAKDNSNNNIDCNDIDLIKDALDVFKWECGLDSGNYYARTTGFKPGKGLGDLIDGATPSNPAWRQNYLIIELDSNSAYRIIYSQPEQWWSNTLVQLPDSSAGLVTLATSNVIYVQSSSAVSRGYNIDDSNIGLVVLPGANLIFDGTDGSTIDASAEAPGGFTAALISVGQEQYFWIEGEFDGNFQPAAGLGLLFGRGNNYNGTIHNSNIHSSGAAGIDFQGDFLTMSDLAIKNNDGNGVTLTDNTFSILDHLYLYNNGANGLLGTDISDTLITKSAAVNNTLAGIQINTTGGSIRANMIMGSLVAHNSGNGIDADNTGILDSSSFNNDGANQINTGSTNEYVSNTIISYNSASNSVYLDNSPSNISTTINEDGLSSSDDSVNPDDSSGQAAYSISLSPRFEYNHLFWVNSSISTKCSSGDICQIFSLAPNGGGANPAINATNIDFSTTCNTNTVNHPWSSGSTTLIKNSVELIDLVDATGNDNGFCESGEICIASKNHGVYQGHSTLSTTSNNCGGGTVMYQYGANDGF